MVANFSGKMKYLLYDFFLKYGGKFFWKDEISSVQFLTKIWWQTFSGKTKYLLYDFLLKYGGKVSLERRSIVCICCKNGGVQ